HFTGTHPGMPGLNNALPQIVPVPCSPDSSHVLIMSNALEQFSELRDARNGTPHHSILRPAQCFALAPLAKKTLRLFVKCSKPPPLSHDL
ncbi:hypothetical protein, partial [Deinococcus wulumuqiensis]